MSSIMKALASDGIFNILFGIIFLVLFISMSILLIVQIILFLHRKNRIKVEILVVLYAFCILNSVALTLRMVAYGCYLAPDFAQNTSVQILSTITAVPNRALITSYTLFFAIILCIVTVQMIRIAHILKPSNYNLVLDYFVIGSTAFYCCVILIYCVIILTDFIIYAAATPQTSGTIFTAALPTTSALIYSTVPLFSIYLTFIGVIYFANVIWVCVRFQKIENKLLRIFQQRDQILATELQDMNCQQLLDQILERPTFAEGYSMTSQSSIKELQYHFKRLRKTLIKCALGVLFMLLSGFFYLIVSVFVGLGTYVWVDIYKVINIVSRIIALGIIVAGLLTKEWFSSLYKEAFHLKNIPIQRIKKQQPEQQT